MDNSREGSDQEPETNYMMSVVDFAPSHGRLSSAQSVNLDDTINFLSVSTSAFDLNESGGDSLLKRKNSSTHELAAMEFESQLKAMYKRKEELDGSNNLPRHVNF